MLNFSVKKSGWHIGIFFKELKVVIGISCLFIIVAMTYVWAGVKMVCLSYDYQALRAERVRLNRENRFIRLEKESLLALPRIETFARANLGMKDSNPKQTIAVFVK